MPPTVNDPFYRAMLESLKYPNPPAGIAAILVNVGESEPVVIHIDLHDGAERVISFKDGEISLHKKSETIVTPEASLQPKVNFTPDSPEARVRASHQVMQHLNPNNMKKIQAIKEARALTGLGLKEAKDLVDKICADEGWTSSSY